MTTAPDTSRRDDRLQESFLAEEEIGLRRGLQLRMVALPVIAIWIVIENDYPGLLFFEFSVICFLLIGMAQYYLWQRGGYREWHRYLFPALDITVLALINFLPNPLADRTFSPQILLRFDNELYAFLVIGTAAFSYRPRVVLWTGLYASIVWVVATLIIYGLPDSLGVLTNSNTDGMSMEELELALLHPRRVHLGRMGRQALVFLLTAGTVAAFVARSRELVRDHADSERRRSNLSRYFSANMVEQLSSSDDSLETTKHQNVAVLFVDIVGFTGLSESMPADTLIRLLRQFHARVQRAVFDHQGTLDKYLGDGAMATFGTPTPTKRDATNALQCADAIRRSIAQWNRERHATGESPIKIGIGAHYGAVVIGDIGGDQRLEFAVLGDTVNVASRIEGATREFDAECLVSEELVEAARAEGDSCGILERLQPRRSASLRGRSAETRLWEMN